MGHPGLGSTEQEVTTFQRLHPRVYLERFLAEKIRPDGRNLHGFRDIDVNEGEHQPFLSNSPSSFTFHKAPLLPPTALL